MEQVISMSDKDSVSYGIRLAILYGSIWFVDLLDATLLNVALPEISKFFQIDPTNAEWALIGFARDGDRNGPQQSCRSKFRREASFPGLAMDLYCEFARVRALPPFLRTGDLPGVPGIQRRIGHPNRHELNYDSVASG
jgi:hypothetical protein